MIFDTNELQYIGFTKRNFNQFFNGPDETYSAFITFHSKRAERKLRKIIGDDEYDAIDGGTETDADLADDLKRVEMLFTGIEMLKADKTFNDNDIMAATVQSRISVDKVTRPSIQELFLQATEILLDNGYHYGFQLYSED